MWVGRGLLLAAALLAQARLADGVFGDRVESPWDDDYHLQPGWAATVEAYRQREYAKRESRLREAREDAVRIATWTAVAIAFTFVSGTAVVWRINSKEAAALHDYVVAHHQTADDVDEMTGAKNRLRERQEARERAGLGQSNKSTERDDYVAVVDGRFGLAAHVDEEKTDKRDSAEEKAKKKLAHETHVLSLIERSFAAVDTDGSGELTRDELRELLKNMHAPHGEQDLDAIMEDLDPDRSGSVSLEEFKGSWASRAAESSDSAEFVARAARQAAEKGGGRSVKASQLKTAND
jgi:hypothetical protein